MTGEDAHLRLIWPQWQGAGLASVRAFAPEFPVEVARRGYAVGAAVLEAVLPPHDGPTVRVPVTMADDGLDECDGIEAKSVVVEQLAAAIELIDQRRPTRITTLGGECSVSVAPFAALAQTYGDELAVIWIDSHPDVGTPASAYPGYHAMAVALLTGHGDVDVTDLLPATVSPSRVALVGLHAWTDDDYPHVAEWGITEFRPSALRTTSRPLLQWLAETGCSKVALHFDVDTVDAAEVVLGLGTEFGGLTTDEVRRVVADVSAAADVVGLTIAEFIPRQVMHLQRVLQDFPLLS